MNAPLFAFLVFAFNLPFGYWRVGLRKRSLSWFLAIHLPVPAVVFLRFFADLDWSFMPFSVVFFSLGNGLERTGGAAEIAFLHSPEYLP